MAVTVGDVEDALLSLLDLAIDARDDDEQDLFGVAEFTESVVRFSDDVENEFILSDERDGIIIRTEDGGMFKLTLKQVR